jgi:hypothetical protein
VRSFRDIGEHRGAALALHRLTAALERGGSDAAPTGWAALAAIDPAAVPAERRSTIAPAPDFDAALATLTAATAQMVADEERRLRAAGATGDRVAEP